MNRILREGEIAEQGRIQEFLEGGDSGWRGLGNKSCFVSVLAINMGISVCQLLHACCFYVFGNKSNEAVKLKTSLQKSKENLK